MSVESKLGSFGRDCPFASLSSRLSTHGSTRWRVARESEQYTQRVELWVHDSLAAARYASRARLRNLCAAAGRLT